MSNNGQLGFGNPRSSESLLRMRLAEDQQIGLRLVKSAVGVRTWHKVRQKVQTQSVSTGGRKGGRGGSKQREIH